MDFNYTEEQQMLGETVRRYLDDHHDFARRRQHLAKGTSREVWDGLARLGAIALLVPEREGGLGGTTVDVLVVARELGRRLVVAPFAESAVVSTRAIATLGSTAQQSTWLPSLAAGDSVVIPVLAGTVAAPGDWLQYGIDDQGRQVLNGKARAIHHAPLADAFLVAAGPGPDQLFLVPKSATGLSIEPYPTVDSAQAADLAFDGVVVDAAACLPGATAETIAALADLAVFALCAEALGSMDEAIALTVEYTRQRQQFGRPLASFQALQHRMVDMQTQVEQARSLVLLAASLVDSADAAARERAVAAAKVLVGEAARFVGQQAVQLHGGMGVTDEMAISHHFRLLTAIMLRGGSTSEHLDRYRDLMVA